MRYIIMHSRGRARVLFRAIVLSLCGALLAACAAKLRNIPTINAASFREEWTPPDWKAETASLLDRGVLGVGHRDPAGQVATAIARANAMRSMYYSAVERGSIKADHRLESGTPASPEMCIALSGGGIRSAAVSMGALKGLHSNGALARAAYLSSTSGGAYAAAWLYAVSAVERLGLDALFANQAVPVPVLQTDPLTGKLVRRDPDPSAARGFVNVFRNAYLNYAITHSDFVGGVKSEGVVISPLLLLRGVTTRKIAPPTTLTPGGLGIVYSKAIRSTFLRGQDIDLPRIAAAQKKYDLPYPVFVGSMAVGKHRPCGSQEFGNSLADAVEITPNRLGNARLGFTDALTAVRLDELVTGVAAAPDKPSFKILCSLGDVLGMDVGLRVTGVRMLPSKIVRTDAISLSDLRALPESDIHISDGGFTENLAVLPLIERMCRQIIVMDAEHDPRLEFDGYRKLKKLLETERGIDLTVPDIDEHLLFKAGTRDRSPLVYYDLRNTRFSADGLRNNALKGTISGITIFDTQQNMPRDHSIEVVYLKLGLDKATIRQQDFFVRTAYAFDFYEEHFRDGSYLKCAEEGTLSERCPFPQESTFRQWYERREFAAYVLLGEYLASLVPH